MIVFRDALSPKVMVSDADQNLVTFLLKAVRSQEALK